MQFVRACPCRRPSVCRPEASGNSIHRSPSTDDSYLGLTTCFIFFGTIFVTAEFLYGRLGQRAEQQRVKLLKEQYLPLPALLAGVEVAYPRFLNLARGTISPIDLLLLFVGLLFLAYAIPGVILALRSRVPYGQVMSRRL